MLEPLFPLMCATAQNGSEDTGVEVIPRARIRVPREALNLGRLAPEKSLVSNHLYSQRDRRVAKR